MKIVLGGYIVSYPLGGMTWHHLNYLLGLRELGHDAFFLEDGGEWLEPYDPTTQRCGPDSSYGRAYLERTFHEYDFSGGWSYYSPGERRYFGATREQLADVLRNADLMICVSGVTALRDDMPRPQRTLVIDTDPVFTQLRLGENDDLRRYYRQFDRVATFGRLIGTPHCPLPTHGFDWIPTNQPVSLKHWPSNASASRRFTTVGKWEHGGRAVQFGGQSYLSSKGAEWMKLIDLPKRVPQWDLTLGMQAMGAELKSQFESHGWSWADPEAAARDCRAFGEFVRGSAGEFTVAKQIYTGIPSGWFSDRAACYLASGRPVITQPTGFEQWMPAGEGVLTFTSIDEAADALARLHQDYDRHSRAARELAERYFDSAKVLADMIDAAM